MAAKQRFDVVLFYVLLLNMCLLKTFGGEENQTNKGQQTGEIITSEDAVQGETKQSDKGIAPGQVVISLDGKTTDGVKPVDDGKKTDIKQSQDGKTTEEVKEAEDVKEPKDDKTTEGEEGKEPVEKKDEEPGIELKVLNDNDFEHLTQASTGATTGDWLVLFTKKENCELCIKVEKEMKKVYERINHKLNVAKVEKGSSSKLTFKRFNIEDLPVIFLFHHGKKFTYEGNKTVETLINFVEGGYELMPWGSVRDPYTYFELFVDETLEELQHMLRYKKNVSLVIFLVGFAVGISLTSICGTIIFHLLENFKDEEDEDVCEALEKHPEKTKNKAE